MNKWRKTGRKKESVSVPAAKLLKCVQLLHLLQDRPMSIPDIADRFDMSTRTAYRYVNLFEEAGFEIEQDFDNRFFITKP